MKCSTCSHNFDSKTDLSAINEIAEMRVKEKEAIKRWIELYKSK